MTKLFWTKWKTFSVFFGTLSLPSVEYCTSCRQATQRESQREIKRYVPSVRAPKIWRQKPLPNCTHACGEKPISAWVKLRSATRTDSSCIQVARSCQTKSNTCGVILRSGKSYGSDIQLPRNCGLSTTRRVFGPPIIGVQVKEVGNFSAPQNWRKALAYRSGDRVLKTGDQATGRDYLIFQNWHPSTRIESLSAQTPASKRQGSGMLVPKKCRPSATDQEFECPKTCG